MNAPSSINRQAVEMARYEALKDAIHRADFRISGGQFWSSYEGLDVLRAMNDFLSGGTVQEAIEVVQGELPDHPVAEDSDPYFSGRIAPFARALGGR